MKARSIESEAQLLSMSSADYMNADQLAFFEHRLAVDHEAVAQSLYHSRRQLRESSNSGDNGELASNNESISLLLRQADRESRLLNKINDALKRISDGSYGFCEETGQPIGLKRLLRRPTTTLSLEAKQRQESKEHHFAKNRFRASFSSD